MECQSDKLMKPAPTEVSEGPQTHQALGTACAICTAGSHLALPYTVAGTSQAAGIPLWPPSSTRTPMTTVLAPQFTEPEEAGALQQPSSQRSWSGCNSKRSRALKVSWQETRCSACWYSSHHTSLPSLLPLAGPVTPAGEERKSKAILKPSLSSSLLIHCAEWYSEKLH